MNEDYRGVIRKYFELIIGSIIVILCCSFVAYNGTCSPQYPSEGYNSTVGDYMMLGVSGYTESGVYYEDNIRDHESGIWGNSDFYENADCYEYYLDSDGQWWRYDSSSKWWQKWINILGWHWSEVLYHEEPSNISHQMFKECPTIDLNSDTKVILVIATLAVMVSLTKTAMEITNKIV